MLSATITNQTQQTVSGVGLPVKQPTLRRCPPRRVRPARLFRLICVLALILLLASASLCARSAPAAVTTGSISLSGPQRTVLAHLVQADPDAHALFVGIKKTATEALTAVPNPIKTIQSEGKLDRDPVKIRTRQSLQDMAKLEALGWTASVDEANGQPLASDPFAAKAKQFILAWAAVNQPTGDPIDETNLGGLFVAYDLTRPVFSPQEQQTVDDWLRHVAAEELRTGPLVHTTHKNNWNSHRLKIVGLIAYLLADPALESQVVEGYHRQVAVNLEADGSSVDFHTRDALHYHCYDLEPLLALAICARQHGIDLYDYEAPSGASLARSVQFLLPYCDGTKTHAEFVHSDVPFDQKRAAAGQATYQAGRMFDPHQALSALALAAAFDPACGVLERRISGHSNAQFASWQDVLDAALAASASVMIPNAVLHA